MIVEVKKNPFCFFLFGDDHLPSGHSEENSNTFARYGCGLGCIGLKKELLGLFTLIKLFSGECAQYLFYQPMLKDLFTTTCSCLVAKKFHSQ